MRRRSPTPAAWLAAVILPVALAAAARSPERPPVRPPEHPIDRPASDRPGGERPAPRPLVERPLAGERSSAEPWTIDDLVFAESATDWTISPDGTLAAWVKSTVGKGGDKEEEARVANLWLTRLTPAAGPLESFPMTRADELVSQPAFSPDGKSLAFLTTRPGDTADEEKGEPAEERTQLWVIPVRGGEAYPVTRFDREVTAFGWIDSDTLVAVAKESPSAGEQRKKERQDTAIAVDDPADEPPVRLFTVSRDGERVRRLTSNEDWIDSIAVSPDGRRAVATAQQSLSYAFDSKLPPKTYLVDLQSGRTTQLFADADPAKPASPQLLPHDVRWARDSSGFYFANDKTRHPRYRLATVTELYYFDVKTGKSAPVDLGWDRGLAESEGGGAYAPTADGFVALLAEGVHVRPARYTRSGRGFRRQDLTGAHAANLESLEVSRDGKVLVYQTSSATQPPQAYAARLDGARLAAERRLTDLNPSFRDKPKGKVEVVHWKGARGDMVEGLLYYPLDWHSGTPGAKRRPLVLDLHGGPAYADADTWLADWEAPDLLLRQRGAFVLKVNYHGSTGYGLDFVESIAGHYYELEIPDIETGVDALVARGLVDPEKLGSMGWSNGGILTVELLTRSHRYKAAAVGAADVEWISDWGNVDFGATFDNYYFGAPPWEKPQLYIEKSPFFRLAQVTTPTLVYAGTEDRDVPPHQAWSLFRALQQLGKAPTRLVLFPGEPHDLRRVAHQRRKLEEDLDWFDRYLFGRPPARREAVKEGTALAALLARTKALRSGNAFGRTENGALVPETVPFHGHEVGRFEVTRAQFARFDPAVQVAPGSENLPMTGVSFARAKEYAAWLAKTAGKAFRLPTADEARDWADLAGSGGNTLDRWAGYSPTPHDRKEIEETLRTIAGEAPLLLPVGSLPGSGDDPVFDLDGNAAEWAVGADGKGVAVGPSAERPTDPRGDDPPSPAYTGLRVVLGR